MRVLKNVLVYLGLAINIIIGIVFSFVEMRTLFAGDYVLFNNPVEGAFAYLFRSLYFLSVIALVIIVVVYRIKHKKNNLYLFVSTACVFAGALFSLLFYDYFVSLAIIVPTLLLSVITGFGFFKKEEVEEY